LKDVITLDSGASKRFIVIPREGVESPDVDDGPAAAPEVIPREGVERLRRSNVGPLGLKRDPERGS